MHPYSRTPTHSCTRHPPSCGDRRISSLHRPSLQLRLAPSKPCEQTNKKQSTKLRKRLTRTLILTLTVTLTLTLTEPKRGNSSNRPHPTHVCHQPHDLCVQTLLQLHNRRCFRPLQLPTHKHTCTHCLTPCCLTPSCLTPPGISGGSIL